MEHFYEVNKFKLHHYPFDAVAKTVKSVIYLMDPSRCRVYARINLDAASRRKEGRGMAFPRPSGPSLFYAPCSM
jgi:hypothetical protein